jgi:hypothetical protein
MSVDYVGNNVYGIGICMTNFAIKNSWPPSPPILPALPRPPLFTLPEPRRSLLEASSARNRFWRSHPRIEAPRLLRGLFQGDICTYLETARNIPRFLFEKLALCHRVTESGQRSAERLFRCNFSPSLSLSFRRAAIRLCENSGYHRPK